MTPLEDKITAVRLARRRVESAQHDLEATLAREFPPGTVIAWRKKDRRVTGVVVCHVYGNRLRVRNSLTGAETKVTPHDIARAMGDD